MSIVNFPIICSNIQRAPAYGVYISQLIRHLRAFTSYHDYLDRELLLTKQPLNQECLVIRLRSSLRQSHGTYHDLFILWRIHNMYLCCNLKAVILSYFMTYQWIFNKSNTTGASSRAGTLPDHQSWSPAFFDARGVQS